jgi:hypothetical protein
MSLWDIDKANSNRALPLLNADDAVVNRMAHTTTAFTLQDIGSSVSSRVVAKDGKVEVYNSSDDRIARVGVREEDSEGAVDVAKPGGAI